MIIEIAGVDEEDYIEAKRLWKIYYPELENKLIEIIKNEEIK